MPKDVDLYERSIILFFDILNIKPDVVTEGKIQFILSQTIGDFIIYRPSQILQTFKLSRKYENVNLTDWLGLSAIHREQEAISIQDSVSFPE